MNPTSFTLDPSYYGLPSLQELKDLRIWSDHYHGFTGGIKQHEEMLFYVKRMGIEKVISLDIGSIEDEPFTPSPYNDAELEILEKDKAHVLGIIRVDPEFPERSCEKMEKWIRNGPCIGIKFLLQKNNYKVSHPNTDKIIRLADELGAAIYIHAWYKVGGTPRTIRGDSAPGENTPDDVAILAKRFPHVPMICGHSGGDWELGARAVRSHENVLFEFAGSWPHSGMVDYAAKILGVNRLVWGCHGPSRSYATELSKVLDASLTHSERMKVFGENYRRTWAKIFRQKDIPA